MFKDCPSNVFRLDPVKGFNFPPPARNAASKDLTVVVPIAIPSVIYTDPELAWAGFTENELNEKGGAWAASKEDQLTRSAELTVEKKNIEELIREQLADKYPFHLSPFLRHYLSLAVREYHSLLYICP